MKIIRFSKIKKFWKEFWEAENAEEYTGDTLGMYIGGVLGTLLMVAMMRMKKNIRNGWIRSETERMRISEALPVVAHRLDFTKQEVWC